MTSHNRLEDSLRWRSIGRLEAGHSQERSGKIKGKIVFQWVPSHCGLWGNERADFLAKKGTGILQNFRRDLTLHSAKLEIKRIFRESFRLTASRVARDKPWSTLCKKSHGIPSSPRAAAVAKFRLLTGHDCLCAHLFRFNLMTSPICVLCDTGQDMTAAHLDECSALNDLNCIVKREIGQRIGRNQANVIRICHRWIKEEMKGRRGRSHPPLCTTARDDRWIVRMAVMDHAATL
ncbi:uncharacterized protein LOC103524116 [Trichonephila clavipes]|nr:uncharacterized protein LOC103524116 [Trichonephila clavipes]